MRFLTMLVLSGALAIVGCGGAADPEEAIWYQAISADGLSVLQTSQDRYTVTLSGIDEDALIFSDIPDSHHGVAPDEVAREVERVKSTDLFERWQLMEDGHENKTVPEDWVLHSPSAAFTMHRSDGSRNTVVFSLDQLVSFDEQTHTAVFDVTGLPGETIEEGDFSDISVFIDGWISIIFWCGSTIIVSIVGGAACGATAGLSCILDFLAAQAAGFECSEAICNYYYSARQCDI